MADPRNPYLPTGLDRLSTMLMALGAGVSGAESRGQSGWAGIGPAAAMYGQANQQANQQAQQYAMWQQQRDELRAHQAVQEENLRSQIDERKRVAGLEGKLWEYAQGFITPGSGTPPGIRPPIAQPTMGPGPELLKEGPQKVAYMTEKHGLPPVAAAGLVGNLYQESKFNPTVVGDNGTAFGLAQWRGDRQTALQAFAQSQGKQPSDPMVQLDFIAHEGKNGDMGAQRAWAMLQTAKTPQEATTALMHYFRPAGYTPNNPAGGHAFNNRVQYAQALVPGAGGGAAPPNAQGQGDASGGGSMPPGATGPQIPNPPPDQRALLPFALNPKFAPFGRAVGDNQNARDKYNWDVYNATTKQQDSQRDQTNKDRDYNFQVKKFEGEGEWVRNPETNKEEWVPKAQLRPGMPRGDKLPEPGTPAGDVAIVSRALKDPTFAQTPEYRAAIARLAEPKLTASGQLMHPDMSPYPQPAGGAPPVGPRVEDTPAARFAMEGKLADDFNALKPVKDYREVVPIIDSMRDAATRNNRVADLNLIYGLAKIMDPTSVVREGEQIMVRNAQSLPEWVQGMISAANGGSQFPPAQRQRIMQEAESRANAFRDQYEGVAGQFKKRATSYGLNFENIITAPTAKAGGADKPASTDRVRRYNPASGKLE